jgi:hypothetical protein
VASGRRADEVGQDGRKRIRSDHGRVAGRCDLTGRISRVGRDAEGQFAPVGLIRIEQVLVEADGLAEPDRKDARHIGIKCAGVADPLLAGQAPQPPDDIVRCHAGWFQDIQETVHVTRLRTQR